jgi:dephospho-CoA kinase
MLALRKVAITGGIACGKSSVAKIFADCGAYVLSADQIVHQLLSSHPPTIALVRNLFGDGVFVDGKIDRSRVAKKAFDSPSLLYQLEKWLHPLVQEEIAYRYKQSTEFPLFVVEVPLLFEAKMESFYDDVVVVAAPEKLCSERFKKKLHQATKKDRNAANSDSFALRQARLLPIEEKMRRAQYVIYNDRDFSDLEKAVKDLYAKLCQ